MFTRIIQIKENISGYKGRAFFSPEILNLKCMMLNEHLLEQLPQISRIVSQWQSLLVKVWNRLYLKIWLEFIIAYNLKINKSKNIQNNSNHVISTYCILYVQREIIDRVGNEDCDYMKDKVNQLSTSERVMSAQPKIIYKS